jgi:carboxypeptidase Taq
MPRTSQEAYRELIRRAKEIAVLGSCASLLDWDQRTYMPARGVAHRAEQLGLLAGLVHRKATDPEIGSLLAEMEGGPLVAERGSDAAVNVREIRRSYERATKLPQSLVEELARATALAHDVWVEARKASDFPRFLPWLDRIVGLKRQAAECLGHAGTPYDALLENYEPGETTAHLADLLGRLRTDLVPLVEAAVGSGRRPDPSVVEREYPVEAQAAFGRAAAAAIGFDFTAGRLDVTVHPFCSGIGPGDTRLTTRYDPRRFGEAFFGVLHEAGHGLYDQGLDPAHYGTPRGEAVSLGIHESQSRLWENFVGRSHAFWRCFLPRAQQAFPAALGDVTLDQFYFAVNDVRPSFIRTEADEATYNLHILLRFELEQAMIRGDLAAADVPAAWNETFRRLLGLAVPDDARGCLQDTHWSGGGIGYFPTYTLGNLYAAQFFARARADLGDLDAQFARGDFAALLGWLREKVHRQGQRYRAGELVVAVTGEPLSHRFLIDHLRAKFGPLYGI